MVSIKNLHEKSLQEIFDFVVTKLHEQGEPSINSDGECVYHQKNEDKILQCSVGFLLPTETEDDLYRIGMQENKKAISVLKAFKTEEEYAALDSTRKVSLISDLQHCHDDPVESFLLIRHGKKYHTKLWLQRTSNALWWIAAKYDLDHSILEGKFQSSIEEE